MTAPPLYDVAGPRGGRRNRVANIVTAVVLVAVLGLVVWRFAGRDQFSAAKWEPFADGEILAGIVRGLGLTVAAAGAGIAGALVLGTVLAFLRLSSRPPLRYAATALVEFFRAIPVLLLILFLFLGFGSVLGQFGALVLALVLFNGAVVAEIVRAGILAIPPGQREASQALGLGQLQTLLLVLLPQAVRMMLPALIGQCVVALKDTALGFVIAYEELIRTAQLIYTGYRNVLPTALVVGTVYVLMNLLVSWLARAAEARLAGTARRPARRPQAAATASDRSEYAQ